MNIQSYMGSELLSSKGVSWQWLLQLAFNHWTADMVDSGYFKTRIDFSTIIIRSCQPNQV